MKVTNKLINSMAHKAFNLGIRFSYCEINNGVFLNGTFYKTSVAYRLLFETDLTGIRV